MVHSISRAFKIGDADYALLEGYARKAGVTLSEYLAILINDHIAEKSYHRPSRGVFLREVT